MKKITNIVLSSILILLLGHLSGLFLPWYSVIIVVAAVVYFMRVSIGFSLLLGFICLFLLWGIHAVVFDMQNAHILSERIGKLFGNLDSVSLVIVTAVLGGIIGLFGAWLGSTFRVLIA